MKEDYIFFDNDGKIYRTSDGYYHHTYSNAFDALMRKKYEKTKKPPEPTAKEKAQKILDQLNADKSVRAEFDRLVRKEKLNQLDK